MEQDAAPMIDGDTQQAGIRGTLDYKTLIFLQMNRCSQLLSTLPKEQGSVQVGVPYESIVLSYANSVRQLEALLSPYIDEDCKKEIITAKDWYNEQIEEKKPKDQSQLTINMFFKRYEAVVGLCMRCGLLLEPLGSIEVG